MSFDRSNDPKYISWAKAVKVKFDYKCVICFADGNRVYLESHHLNSWDWDIQNRYNLDNSACLCEFCHKKFHQIFGYGNNYKYQFEQFKEIYKIFQNLISSAKEKSTL